MTGLKKEIRMLAWPAAAVLGAVSLPLVWGALMGEVGGGRGWPLQAAFSAFVLGTALLVALPFGAEFQQRTLGLVLSQPVGRSRVWFEKWAALLAVLLVPAAIGFVALDSTVLEGGVGIREPMILVALACSGFFWTLVAGSTIGGAAFGLAGLAIVEMASTFITSRVTGLDLDLFSTHPAPVAVRSVYAAAMLWLGWRSFATFEPRAQGESPGVLPLSVLETIPALRCRSDSAIANLVRKELRLQQPVALIAALFALCWLVAMLLFSIPPGRPAVADVVFTTLLVSYVPLVFVVCGTISIGEETSLGLRAWSLTLPVSSMTQWAVKLGVMLIVGGALGFALPVALKLVTPAFVSLPAGTIQLPAPALASAAVVLLVVSFWSATLFGHTVKAVVATGVAVPALWICIVLANLAGQRLGVGSGWLTSLMVANQWSPEDLLRIPSRRLPELAVWISIGVLALLALRQSLAAFRAPQVDRRRIVRCALQLMLAAAIVSFIPTAYLRAAGDQYRSQPVRELQAALQQLSVASMVATGQIPGSVSAAELEATGQLSEDARHWLAGSRISLKASAPRSQAAELVMFVRTDVRFPSGSAFRMLYSIPPAR